MTSHREVQQIVSDLRSQGKTDLQIESHLLTLNSGPTWHLSVARQELRFARLDGWTY